MTLQKYKKNLRNALLETFILVMKHFLMMLLLYIYICIIFHDSKKHQSYSVRPLGKKSPCATKRTHLYYGQQESRMVGTCVSDKI